MTDNSTTEPILQKQVEINHAALSLALAMIDFWTVSTSAEDLYKFMRSKTQNCDVIAKASEYWALAMQPPN